MTPPTLPNQIETARLILRPPRSDDAAIIHALVIESFAHLHPWMEFCKTLPAFEESHAFAIQAAERHASGEEYVFMMMRKSDGVFLGNTGIHTIDWGVPRMEIGYWIGAQYEGQGYVSETVRALVDLCFITLGAVRLEIRCDARNQRSAAAAERAGFHLEARLVKERRANDGTLTDSLIYVRLADDALAR